MKKEQINRIIGQRLKEEREKRGYSKSYVGERLGVTRQAVAYWEDGTNSITVVMLERYCALLNLELFDFIKKTGL